MIQKYEELKTPFYYEYMDGWAALLQNISTFILMLALVIGFLVSGIFSDEFQSKADSIFFSARFGRSRGISAKVGAGFCITTGFYLMFVYLFDNPLKVVIHLFEIAQQFLHPEYGWHFQSPLWHHPLQ